MFLAFVFWIGCKWIKKGGLCARGWENREPFFIDLLWGKQVLKTHKIPLVRWGALDWVGETTSAKRSYSIINQLIYTKNKKLCLGYFLRFVVFCSFINKIINTTKFYRIKVKYQFICITPMFSGYH